MTPLPNDPLVSVVIIAYGRPQFLEEAIASVASADVSQHRTDRC